MIVSIQFQQFNLRMAYDLKHSGQVGILFISTYHFKLTITRNQGNGNLVFSNPIQGSKLIHYRLIDIDSFFGTSRKMADALSTERSEEHTSELQSREKLV